MAVLPLLAPMRLRDRLLCLLAHIFSTLLAHACGVLRVVAHSTSHGISSHRTASLRLQVEETASTSLERLRARIMDEVSQGALAAVVA